MVRRSIAAGALMLAASLAVGPLAVVVGSLALAADPHPGADPRTEKAREHYLQGDAYYKLEKYSNALQEYEQAYLAKQDPSFLYNIAQCRRLMGDKADAIKFYRQYLKDAPNAPNRAVAEKHIKDLEVALAGPAGTPPPPTSSPGSPPAPVSPVVAIPPPQMPAPAPGPASTTSPPTLALNAPPPAPSDAPSGGRVDVAHPPSQDESRPIYTKWWFWTGIGVLVTGALVIAFSTGHDPACPTGRVCQ
jgi:tetratricopeptide (TPR) repeat protein